MVPPAKLWKHSTCSPNRSPSVSADISVFLVGAWHVGLAGTSRCRGQRRATPPPRPLFEVRSDDKQGVEKKLPLVDDDDGWPESGTRVGAKGELVHTPLFLFSGSMIVLRMYMRLFFEPSFSAALHTAAELKLLFPSEFESVSFPAQFCVFAN